MKVSGKLQRLVIESLSQSMPVQTMVRLARLIFKDYDIYVQTGIPENIPIQKIDAARQIVNDVMARDLMLKLLEILVKVSREGIMGRRLTIRLLPQIFKEVEALGVIYKEEYETFVENDSVVMTKGWGLLHDGDIYDFSFLRIDIVGNTQLVREYTRDEIVKTYSRVKKLFQVIIEKRNGRLWEWEGDGGFAAFYFSDKNQDSVLCGIEFSRELFLYNILNNALKNPIQVRMAIHTGPCQFYQNTKEIKNDTLLRLEKLESEYSEPDTIFISPGVYSDLGGKLEKLFDAVETARGNTVYRYALKWGK
ncbi:MAG: hypothetical protein JW969_04525 [Spirochaetales bacterium]|nr:hypothetical protein [Spirochaetales bacterium]